MEKLSYYALQTISLMHYKHNSSDDHFQNLHCSSLEFDIFLESHTWNVFSFETSQQQKKKQCKDWTTQWYAISLKVSSLHTGLWISINKLFNICDDIYPLSIIIIIPGKKWTNGTLVDLEPNLWDKYSVSNL